MGNTILWPSFLWGFIFSTSPQYFQNIIWAFLPTLNIGPHEFNRRFFKNENPVTISNMISLIGVAYCLVLVGPEWLNYPDGLTRTERNPDYKTLSCFWGPLKSWAQKRNSVAFQVLSCIEWLELKKNDGSVWSSPNSSSSRINYSFTSHDPLIKAMLSHASPSRHLHLLALSQLSSKFPSLHTNWTCQQTCISIRLSPLPTLTHGPLMHMTVL